MMHETDKQFLERMAVAGCTAVPKYDLEGITDLLKAALKEIDVSIVDLRRLASGDYTLCDGYCQAS